MISDTQLSKFLKISALILKRIPHYGFISRTLSSVMSSSIVTRQELTGIQYATAVESEKHRNIFVTLQSSVITEYITK